MIVIATKTETKLRDDLQQCVKTRPQQRCFFLEFSKTNIAKGVLFETFLMTLADLPNSYMARIYLCQDKDILIVMDGFMQRQFLDFVKKLSAKLEHNDMSDLIDVFELGVHWEKLEKIYTDKIDKIIHEKEIEEERKRIQKAEENTMAALLQINADKIKTLQSRRHNRQKPVIMIADDDQLARTLAGNVLRADYDMAFAKNGKEALTIFVEQAPDILFLDIGMPDIGGHEVLESLFQMDPEAYVIMFSGRKDEASIMASLEKGAQGFLSKPFSRDELYAHVYNSPFVQVKQHNVA